MDLIVSYLKQFGSGTKADFIRLLGDKLSDVLDDKQKDTKIKNILASLRKDNIIEYANGNKRTGIWIMVAED